MNETPLSKYFNPRQMKYWDGLGLSTVGGLSCFMDENPVDAMLARRGMGDKMVMIARFVCMDEGEPYDSSYDTYFEQYITTLEGSAWWSKVSVLRGNGVYYYGKGGAVPVSSRTAQGGNRVKDDRTRDEKERQKLLDAEITLVQARKFYNELLQTIPQSPKIAFRRAFGREIHTSSAYAYALKAKEKIVHAGEWDSYRLMHSSIVEQAETEGIAHLRHLAETASKTIWVAEVKLDLTVEEYKDLEKLGWLKEAVVGVIDDNRMNVTRRKVPVVEPDSGARVKAASDLSKIRGASAKIDWESGSRIPQSEDEAFDRLAYDVMRQLKGLQKTPDDLHEILSVAWISP